MSLRRQLLLVGLLTLFLPWAGLQYVTELESALREGQQSSLQDSANAIASIMKERRQLLYRYRSSLSAEQNPGSDLYAHPLPAAISIDGFDDDWALDEEQYRTLQQNSPTTGTQQVRYAVGADRNNLYLYLEVTDDKVIYRNDALGPVHDLINLVFWDSFEKSSRLIFETDAPGEVRAVDPERTDYQNTSVPQVRANWQPTSVGYNVEIQIPQSLVGPRFGVAIIDGDGEPLDPLPFVGTVNPYDEKPFPGLLTQPLPELETNVTDLTQSGRRLRVVDRHGWILAEGGQLRESSIATGGQVNLIDRLYQRILDPRLKDYPDTQSEAGKILGPEVQSALQGTSSSIWYQPERLTYAIISAAAPIYDEQQIAGAVILEQTSAETLLLTNNTLKRILSVTFFSTALVVVGLLGFATLLSWRIRKLRNATEHAMADDGVLQTDLPGADANDELGDLSRSFQRLLQQLKSYTQYLRSLASKLSHELRTPLAVVQSSLDNLQSQELSEQTTVYANRANAGVARLRYIITAMSAASRIEQSIETAEFHEFDLAAFIKDMAQGYQDTYQGHVIDAQTPHEECTFFGVADLLAQMLDKLVENAVDFTPAGGAIQFSLEKLPRRYVLRITNEGPPLPDQMQENLFESLISVRGEGSTDSEKTHLGFGLFIARLVVTLHRGEISAGNLPDDTGVEFRINLPRKRRKQKQ